MKSPDGQCWRSTLDNSGTLIFVTVNCENLKTGSIDNKSAELVPAVLYNIRRDFDLIPEK